PAHPLHAAARGRGTSVGRGDRPGRADQRRPLIVSSGPVRPVPRFGPDELRIERVETLALRAPLARRYSGSAYSMVNRCTIVTRLTTADGLVLVVYTGDTD